MQLESPNFIIGNSLLSTIVAKEEDLLESMKKITLKGYSILEAFWNRAGKETLSNCWKKLLNMVNDDDPEYNAPLSVLKSPWSSR